MATTPINLRDEAETLQHIRAGKLIEGIEHMSPTYLEGMKRILTVSADTELISAPAYLRAAQDAPSLNAFGSAIRSANDQSRVTPLQRRATARQARVRHEIGVGREGFVIDSYTVVAAVG